MWGPPSAGIHPLRRLVEPQDEQDEDQEHDERQPIVKQEVAHTVSPPP
ncbi:MAG: hypothetical protein WBJ32_01105 [Bacillota bacterium]|nr:hypothetical protein [Bacillota bacterium]